MNWFGRLFSTPDPLPPALSARLAGWRARPAPRHDRPMTESRYVVVDVESSGLDPLRDRLIAIGAVAVDRGRIALADSFEVVLQQSEASAHDNILIHGIGGTMQRTGTPPAEALLAFLDYLGKDPLIAFHVAFDQALIARAMRAFLGLNFEHDWVDLAFVAPALHPRIARRTRTLDDWTRECGIANYARHTALADALATAELLLRLRVRLDEGGHASFRGLKRLQESWRRQTPRG